MLIVDTDKGSFKIIDGKLQGADSQQVADSSEAITPVPAATTANQPVVQQQEKGNKQVVVIDGKPGPEYDEIKDVTVSPDGKRTAYRARIGKKWCAVVDGQPGRKYDNIIEGSVVFSPDGKRVAYWVSGPLLLPTIVVDDQKGPEYFEYILNSMSFLPDGSVGYLAKKKTGLFNNVGALHYYKLTMLPSAGTESGKK